RSLLNAAYTAIKQVQPGATVFAAGLAPYGDPPGVNRMHPVAFLRSLLCLSDSLHPLPCPHPAMLDGIDVHPYSLTPTSPAISPDDVGVSQVGRLWPVLRAALRYHTVLPDRSKAYWVTEIDWDSKPPDPHGTVTERRQATFLSASFYRMWREGIDHVFWFLFQDIPHLNLVGDGLYTKQGRPKVALRAMQFPFVALGPDREITIWGRAPKPGTVTIEQGNGHDWSDVLFTLHTTPDGVFYARYLSGGHVTLRAVQGKIASLAFTS